MALARVYAVQASTPVRPTIERLEAAIQAGLLSREGATAIAEAFRYLLFLRLREQLSEIKAGQTPDDKIRLGQLLAREKRHLKESFVYIRNLQDTMALNFGTDRLG